MYGSFCMKEEHNGSKAVSLLLRLCTLGLSITSAVVMATANGCTVADGANGAPVTIGYSHYRPFVYLVWCNICAAILEAAAIYLQLSMGGDDDEEAGGKPGVILVVVDVVAQALLYSATGAAYAAAAAYGWQIGGCFRLGQQVERAKMLSVGASVAVGLAAVAKDVPLPFSVWPSSSD